MLNNDGVFTVEGEDEQSCMMQIERQYAKGSYIVMSRKNINLKTGPFKLFKKPGVQVTYAVNHPNSFYRNSMYNSMQKNFNFETSKNEILEKSGKKIDAQIDVLTEAVKQIQNTLDTKTFGASEAEHPTITKLTEWLEDNEFSALYIKKICEKARKEFSVDDLEDFDEVKKQVTLWIGENIKVSNVQLKALPEIILLVGPTGVGKTTTIAKLAYKYAYDQCVDGTRKIGHIITTDWNKIGAFEQINTFAYILEMPVSKVTTHDDFVKIIEQNKDHDDFIIVDTAGFSPKDYENLAKLKKVLGIKNYKVQVLWCMSASTKLSDMKDIMQQFEIFGYDSVIITKFDESNHIGNIVCALESKNKSISYITTGQEVPECIEEASVGRFLLELSDCNLSKEVIEDKFGPIVQKTK